MEKQFIELTVGFLEERKKKYEERGMIPTLELLIEDLKETYGDKSKYNS